MNRIRDWCRNPQRSGREKSIRMDFIQMDGTQLTWHCPRTVGGCIRLLCWSRIVHSPEADWKSHRQVTESFRESCDVQGSCMDARKVHTYGLAPSSRMGKPGGGLELTVTSDCTKHLRVESFAPICICTYKSIRMDFLTGHPVLAHSL